MANVDIQVRLPVALALQVRNSSGTIAKSYETGWLCEPFVGTCAIIDMYDCDDATLQSSTGECSLSLNTALADLPAFDLEDPQDYENFRAQMIMSINPNPQQIFIGGVERPDLLDLWHVELSSAQLLPVPPTGDYSVFFADMMGDADYPAAAFGYNMISASPWKSTGLSNLRVTDSAEYTLLGDTLSNGLIHVRTYETAYVTNALALYTKLNSVGFRVQLFEDLPAYLFSLTAGVDSGFKPSKINPIAPGLSFGTTVNRIFIKGGYAIVYYSFADVPFTQCLVKGNGDIWHGLGDGYITKALIFDRFAWVYIGNEKYLCKDLGQDLMIYG